MSAEPVSKEKVQKDAAGSNVLLDLDQYIPFQLVYSQLLMHRALRPENDPLVSEKISLTKNDCRVLVNLRLGRADSPSSSAETLALDGAVITRHIASLEKNGLIASKKDPEDLRRKKLHLTARGKKISDRIMSLMIGFSEFLDASITPEEKQQLTAILEKLNKRCLAYGQ